MSRRWYLAALLAVVIGALGAVGRTAASPKAANLEKVTLQLKWVTQAQFAGYYAAAAQGYYKDAGLDVKIKVGGPNITPERVVAGGQAQFGIDWLPSLLATRDTGTDLVNVAQVFTRSGMTELTWKDSGITSIKAMAKKKVGVWCCGNQLGLYAALTKNGINPTGSSAVTIVNQPFDMNLFLQRQVDAAAAMTYNELAQVLESKSPKTGKLYTLRDVNVIKLQNIGTGLLEDGIFTTGSYLKDPKHVDVAKRFVAASLKGWAYCRDNASSCVDEVLKSWPTLGKGHQTWQMNEINALIWPASKGVGVMDPAAYATTAKIAQQFKVIKKAPAAGAYRTDIAKAAVATLKQDGVDVTGANWNKAAVTVTPGGK